MLRIILLVSAALSLSTQPTPHSGVINFNNTDFNYECYSPGELNTDYLFVWTDNDNIKSNNITLSGNIDNVTVSVELRDTVFGYQGINEASNCFKSGITDVEIHVSF